MTAYEISHWTGLGRADGSQGTEDGTGRTVLGSTTIGTALLRRLLCTGMTLQVQLPLPREVTEVKPDKEEAEQDGSDSQEGEAAGGLTSTAEPLLSRMRRDLHELEGLGKAGNEGSESAPYILLQLRAVSSRSRVVQSPLSIFSIRDAKLLNLHGRPGWQGTTGTPYVTLQLSTPSSVVESDRATSARLNLRATDASRKLLDELRRKHQQRDPLPSQEGLCLLSAEGQRDQLLSEGCGYRLGWGKRALEGAQGEPLGYFHWGEGGEPLTATREARASP